MTRTSLLIIAILTSVLLLVIGIYVQSDTDLTVAVPSGSDLPFSPESATRLTASKPSSETDQRTSSGATPALAISSGEENTTAAIPIEDTTSNAASELSASDESIEVAEEPALPMTNRTPVSHLPRVIPRWVKHVQAQIRFQSMAPKNAAPTALAKDPAVENAPPLSIEPLETVQTKAEISSDLEQQAGVANPASDRIDPAHPSRWPRGPFTPEEQRYRAQFGWQAFDAALRERALASEDP